MPKTVAVNIKYEKCDFKACRKRDNSIPDPPEEGFAGNPFFLADPNDDLERRKVIDMYRDYFLDRIQRDMSFRNAIIALYGKRLGCFCKPKPCHVDVIIKWLDDFFSPVS